MWPVLFQVGDYDIGTYGLLVAIAMMSGLWVARHLCRRDGLDPQAVNDMGLGVLFFGFLGSVLLGLFVSWQNGVAFTVAELRNAGAVHGGLLGALLSTFLLSRSSELPLRPLLDAFAPGAALGQAIGRLGCFFSGCCFGTPSSAPWAVTFSQQDAHRLGGVPLHVSLHPVQIYDLLLHLALFAGLFYLHTNSRFWGRLVAVWCILEGVIRLLIETFRGDTGRGFLFGIEALSTGRVTALLLIAVGAFLLSKKLKNGAGDAAQTEAGLPAK